MTNKHLQIFLFFATLILAMPVSASVVVSEIAWMGNTSSSNAEWIELQNTGPGEVSLDGWSLSAIDGGPTIALSGSIGSGDFFILERTSDDSLPGVVADLIYSGALGNSGEDLILSDSASTEVDSLLFGSGWPAGDNGSKQTMQRTDSGWITDNQSPGSSLVSLSAVPEVEPVSTATNTDPVTTKTPSPSSAEARPPDIDGFVIFPEQILTGQLFTALIDFTNHDRYLPYAEVHINFGDGTYQHQKITQDLHHRYLAPGVYTVRYELRSQPWRPEAELSGEQEIEVISPYFYAHHQSDSLILENKTEVTLDLSGWSIFDNQGRSFILPPMSILPGNDHLLLNSPLLHNDIKNFSPALLIDTYGVQYNIQKEETTRVEEVPVQKTAAATSRTLSPRAPKELSPEETEKEERSMDLLAASIGSSPLVQENTTRLWSWFGLGLLILLNLLLFALLTKKHLHQEESPDQLDLFRP